MHGTGDVLLRGLDAPEHKLALGAEPESCRCRREGNGGQTGVTGQSASLYQVWRCAGVIGFNDSREQLCSENFGEREEQSVSGDEDVVNTR